MQYQKGGYIKVLNALTSKEGREQLERQTGRTMQGLLLGDFARTDVQARIANEIIELENGYQLRYGKTYLAAWSKLLPRSFWLVTTGDISFKNEWGKSKAFTDLNSGLGLYHPWHWFATRIYGLGGEAMLNFGLPGLFIAWMIFGAFVGWLRKKRNTLIENDTRWTIMPLITLYTINVPILDMDNIVFGIFASGTVIFILTFLWSNRLNLKKFNYDSNATKGHYGI
jgi:hypothetical protein